MAEGASSRESEIQFLRDEYEQCWAHFRHIENQRNQYLGFFFTVSLGTAAFAGSVITRDDPAGDRTLAVSGAFVSVYLAVTMFVWICVRRNGRVLGHYDAAIVRLRTALEEACAVQPGNRGVLTVALAEWRGFRGARLQRTAELTIAGFTIVGVGTQITLFVVGVAHSSRAIVPIALGVLASAGGFVFWQMISPPKVRKAAPLNP